MARNDENSELILGIISTVGTDADFVIKTIQDRLEQFKYQSEVYSVSKLIISQFNNSNSLKFDSEYNRISYYMDLGNNIRVSTEDNSILMKGVAGEINSKREADVSNSLLPRGRVAYIINSLKHPEEVEFMRDTYGDSFYLLGVTSSHKRRVEYLTNHKNMDEKQAMELLARDAREDIKQGQHTQDAFQHADFFINLSSNTDRNHYPIFRFLDLIFGEPFFTPTFDEYAMFMAYASSLRSADLSRQVGAVIARDDEILSAGANDCPKFGGGLYWPTISTDGKYIDDENGRDYKKGCDSNKIEQQKIIKNILQSFSIEPTLESTQAIKDSGLGDITEYGRVVHGEMEALLACARNNISSKDATIYVTTFPCHNCAKHIIAAGIKRVVYIEPYPKSKAFHFYTEEISDSIENGGKVLFEAFTGIGPQKYVDLFSLTSNKWYARKRKDEEGKTVKWERNTAELRHPLSLTTYLEAESAALVSFAEETNALRKDTQNE